MASSTDGAPFVAILAGDVVVMSLAAAFELIARTRIDLVMLEKASRDGLRLTVEQRTLVDVLKAGAAKHRTASGVVDVIIGGGECPLPCPHGRPQVDAPTDRRILLGSTEIAQRIDRNVRTVRRLLAAEALGPIEWIGGHRKVEEKAVLEYLEARRKESA